MRYILKATEPYQFVEWKALASPEWTPHYDLLAGEPKRALLASLLAEQGWTCCYCGRSTNEAECHIEHFHPQDPFVEEALDYQNLHASCIRNREAGDPLHCGHGKGDGFNIDGMISPLDPGCEERFIYIRQTGAIQQHVVGDGDAAEMIKLLKLDIAILQQRRANVLKNIFSEELLDIATDAQLQIIIDDASGPGDDQRLPSFAHVIRRYGRQLIENRRRHAQANGAP